MIGVKECIANILGIKDLAVIADDGDIVEKLNADSLDMVEIVMELEDTYNISIPDEIGETFKTANDMLKYLISLGL